MKIDSLITLDKINTLLPSFWDLVIQKVQDLNKNYNISKGSPVFTINGKYTSRGWTEWTQGFQYGIPLLAFDATGETDMLSIAKENIKKHMPHHLTHFGVHDHGFNNVSTYGNLLRLANENKFTADYHEKEFYKLALKVSGTVQAKRWTTTNDGGYLYSFNGPHSLFIDTMRTCRSLLVAHHLGHRMLEEHDEEIDLLDRAITHGLTTAKYAVYYDEGRDFYDELGRVAHESIFNLNDGAYRCPNTQQGFSGFTTWTRGLAWAMLGFTEFLEFLNALPQTHEKIENSKNVFLKAAMATCDFYIANTAADGIPYWDTGAPNLYKLGNYRDFDSQPNNNHEPVDSSAAAIGAQGLIRLGILLKKNEAELSKNYITAGLKVTKTLLSHDYLANDPAHQGIIKHSIYHRPNGWDHTPKGSKIPVGESSMWGDYHMVELCLLVQKLSQDKNYTFFSGIV
ncbi:glycoside hydrolase family 88 protein [Ulvibacterium marinum]|uniref:Glycosyl hydrolase n=1 Tax=Ulvibacterium marinum TaxID=2419782 RepID=A0A3B0CBK1_9FLAO|nr:glycoside hydrolase family 88 protein [Ulvibacterium marinum]RKN83442.1 glycosyl hydrolase [Ulvibacterium marinum]